MDFVGLFFVVKGKLLLHECNFEEAEEYGDFLNYPLSHMEVWEKFYSKIYHVDFDFYPRGRIIYNTKTQEYYLYYDRCLQGKLEELQHRLEGKKVKLSRDFHYQCHFCNKNYII